MFRPNNTFLRMPALALAVVIGLPPAVSVRAHETNPYTLPAGRQFADLGPHFNRYFYKCIERGVEKTNTRIREALREGKSPEQIAQLQSDEQVTRAVNREFPYAILFIEDLDRQSTSHNMMRAYPGYLTGYKPPPTVKHMAMWPLNPMRAWGCSTMNVYGVLLGSDKVGHFTDMGMHYYQTYRGHLKKGLSEEQAVRKAIEVGMNDPVKGESNLLGYWTAGAYSNADLVANYSGMLFYRNLTEPQRIAGEMRPPMLRRDGEFWTISPHVRADSDFMKVFLTEHLDEALNPSHYLPNMRAGIRADAEANASAVLDHRADAWGNRRSQRWFAEKTRELRTYWGFDYGHRGNDDELILIDRTCFTDAAGQSSRALHAAAQDGREEDARALLGAGADVNAADQRSVAPLHLSVGHESMVQLLLDSGARVDATDVRGRTPLHYAAGEAETPVLALLLVRGADANARDASGQTPLHVAAKTPGRTTALAELIRRGSDVRSADAMARTPLHVAARAGNVEQVRILLSAGASPTAADALGRTALHEASRAGAVEIASMLVEAGAVPTRGDAYGSTAIDVARRAGQTQLAQSLEAHTSESLAAFRTAPDSAGGNGAAHR